MTDNKVIVYSVIVSWACIICILLFLQFSSFQQIKELQKISMSQAFEISQLKEELYHISFASLDHNIPINSKKLVLNSIPSGYLKHYYKLEKLRLSFDISYWRDNHLTSLVSQLTNKNVKILMIVDPCEDMLKVVKQFPNLEELILGFQLNHESNYPYCKATNLNEPDLSHLIYPSKIKKIVLVKKNNIDISPVVSYYRQQNKEVIIDETSAPWDIYTKYDFY